MEKMGMLQKMKKAVGFPLNAVEKRNHLAYRNVYLSEGEPDLDWEELVSHGYAENRGREFGKSFAYALNGKGIALLEGLLGCRISLLGSVR